MLIDIDSSRRGTLTEQIVNGIQHLVEERRLRFDTRLPSIRRFAAAHKISTFTVVQAYDRLVASGHVRSRPGSGFFVGKPASPVASDDGEGRLDKATDALWLMHRQTKDFEFKHLPGSGSMPSRWLADSGLAQAMRSISRLGDSGFIGGYANPRGFTPLREAIGRQLSEIGIGAPPDQILLTVGITGAIDLLGRYLLRPGDVVLVDDPGYFQTFGHMQFLGATVRGVPWTATGPDLEQLETLARTLSPRLFITSPIVQNPTGRSMSRGSAFRLLQLAEQYDFYVIEDDMFAVFHPAPPPRLASLDQLNRVIHVNSFSKDLSPQIRVGYLAGHRDLVRELLDVKMLTQATTTELTERLVHEALVNGQFRKHLARLSATIRRARDKAQLGLEAIGLKSDVGDFHGVFAWMTVPGANDTVPLAETAAERGMLLAPGAMFRPGMAPSSMMRFNVGFCQAPGTFRLLEAVLNPS